MITLYRGDSTKIDEFKFNRTYKRCLWGQGVYLTDTLDIAETYRRKGRHWRFDLRERYNGFDMPSGTVLYSGKATDRNQARDLAFPAFICAYNPDTRRFDNHSNGFATHISGPKDGVDNAVSRANKFLGRNTGKKYRVEHWIEPYEEHKYNFNMKRVDEGRLSLPSFTVSVSKELVPWLIPPGWISAFSFYEEEIRATLDVSDFLFGISDNPEMIFRTDSFGTNASVINDYCVAKYSRTIVDFMKKELKWTPSERPPTIGSLPFIKEPSFRRHLENYGYIGFEYDGGLVTGGRRHRAFVIWDDDLVNARRTCVKKEV